MDYKKDYPEARQGFNLFFQRFHEETGVGATVDTGGIARLLNLSEDLAALRPHVVFVEFMSYFNNLVEPGASDLLSDIRALTAPPYSFDPSQVSVGVGLSSASFAGAHRSSLARCMYWGWYGCTDAHSSAVHRSEGLTGRTWDELNADVATGRAVRGVSGEAQGFARWSWYGGAAAVGEATFFNTEAELDDFAVFVRNHSLGGVFTWIATSDALDWRVHRRLYSALNSLPAQALVVADGSCAACRADGDNCFYPKLAPSLACSKAATQQSCQASAYAAVWCGTANGAGATKEKALPPMPASTTEATAAAVFRLST